MEASEIAEKIHGEEHGAHSATADANFRKFTGIYLGIVATQASVAQTERGVVTGAQMFMRMIGMSSGAALFGAIVNYGVYWRLPGADDAVNKLLLPGLREGLGADEAARLADAVADSAHYAFLAAAAIAAATWLLVLAFPKGLSPVRAAAR